MVVILSSFQCEIDMAANSGGDALMMKEGAGGDGRLSVGNGTERDSVLSQHTLGETPLTLRDRGSAVSDGSNLTQYSLRESFLPTELLKSQVRGLSFITIVGWTGPKCVGGYTGMSGGCAFIVSVKDI